ncbi:DNA topoisomerase 3-alpha isoform X1 [Polistes fuscatus]|uniref:DNA topoisomerase 3-alpha isoform X1 n=1 Tax=Polistes fuscatus TaxID=30207 RepID=UPI001CA80F19|nr:DNA topoisomerase 3-alpha isoform X1 [Polistes fuscatus]
MTYLTHYVIFVSIFKNTKINVTRLLNNKVSIVRNKSTNHNIMKVLNVAEKNDAAKNIAGYLSRGNIRKRDGLSVYNKIYEFNVRLWNEDCQMIMTSVSGHLLGYEFVGAYRKWQGCHPLSLFDAPVVKNCIDDNYLKIKKTIEKEVKSCRALIIWTDCDREGENIGFEIIEVCKAVKPDIRIYRAKFSEITQASINRALQTLDAPNKAISEAVNIRSELDLRIGAAFTRFQTLRLQKVFPRTLADMLISYGSCQFPTLGFVVERFLAIERFKPEPYWKIKVMNIHSDISVEFRWDRIRLFEELPCQIFLDMCQENPIATVTKVTSKPKSKWRPLPLDTIELEKQGSRKLRLNAKETMKIAEKLYTQGLISYPRTETNIFPKELNLQSLVSQHTNSSIWGQFAQRLMEDGISPRQGKKSDQAHPPIHPTKFNSSLQGNEAKVYEFIVRHFLACLSKNAEGQETIVEINIAGEKFLANGLQIIAKNYLEIYIYEKWSDKEIHRYQEGQTFQPTSIEMIKEETSPPKLLTEADLIALMDKHGIGTDATHAEHIETIKSRQYVGLQDGQHFIPSKLGIGLVMGYDNMGFPMSKPNLRADLEKDLKLICDGQKDPKLVLQDQITKYRDVFKVAMEHANLIDNAIAEYLEEQPLQVQEIDTINTTTDIVVFKCPKCNSDMTLKNRKQGTGKYISCMGFPACNNAIWFPQSIEDVIVLEDTCTECSGNMRKIKFKLARNMIHMFGSTYTTCIGGCDPNFNETIGIKEDSVKKRTRVNDSGYETMSNISVPETLSRVQMRNNTEESISNSRTNTQRNNLPRQNENRGRNPPTNNRRKDNTGSTKMKNNTNNLNLSRGFNNNSTNINNIVTWGNIDNDAEIMCQCNQRAIQLTVKKDGPNKGRQFYKCEKPQGSGCDFFLWASDRPQEENTINHNNHNNQNVNWSIQNPTQQPSTSSNSANWRNTSVSESDNVIMCTCNEPARQLTVQKEGPNKGRLFYTCPKGRDSTCNFFKWADVDGGINTNERTNWGNSGNRNSNTTHRGNSSTSNRSQGTRSKRKCGICGVEGHTRKTCPENVMDK